jgi:hypothetical protein
MLEKKKNLIIYLTTGQLIAFGVQIGHKKRLSCFLAG